MYVFETTVVLDDNSLGHWKFPLSEKNYENIDQTPVALITDPTPFHQTVSIRTDTRTPSTTSYQIPTSFSDNSGNAPTGIFPYNTKLAPDSTSSQNVTPLNTGINNHRMSNDRQTTKVILGSILGGVLGFALFLILIFCLLNYFGSRIDHSKKKQARKINIFPLPSPSSNSEFQLFGNSSSIRRNINSQSSSNDRNSGSSPAIPINEKIVPYDVSPFESRELLKFNPTNPKNMFHKHEKLPKNIKNLTRPCTTPEFQGRRDSIQSGVISCNKPEIPVSSDHNKQSYSEINNTPINYLSSETSSVYSSRSCNTNNEKSEGNDNPHIPDLFKDDEFCFRDSCVVEKARVGPEYSHNGDSYDTHQVLHNASKTTSRESKGPAATIYDDGYGNYSDLYFDEQLIENSVEIPQIPPTPSLSRRQNALKKIREYSSQIKRYSNIRINDFEKDKTIQSNNNDLFSGLTSTVPMEADAEDPSAAAQSVFNDYILYSDTVIRDDETR